jgi:hypothetical protein
MHKHVGKVICALVALVPFARTARAQERVQVDTTFAFRSGGEVSLSLPGGDIRVTGWARNEVRVVVSAMRGALSTSFTPSLVRLETRNRAGSSRGRYEISVPIGTRVSASTMSGAINISGTRGSVSLSTFSGGITASDVSGRSDIETVSGPVVLQRVDGATRVVATSSTVRIDEIAGDLDIEAMSSGAKIERGELANLRFDAAAGQLDYAGTLAREGRHSIHTLAGKITLRVPADFGMSIEFGTLNGQLRPGEFPLVLMPNTSNSRGRNSDRQDYTVNGGGTRINIETFSGDVFLMKIAPSKGR